ERRARALSPARRRDPRPRRLERSRTALLVSHRLGLRAPGRDTRPAHERLGRRQRGRAADGGRLAPLRPYPRQRGAVARPGGDRGRPHRPGARRPARALHPAPRVLDPASMSAMEPLLQLTGVAKSFTMHLQGGIRLPVVAGVEFAVGAGECVALAGPSGAGKSSVLKMIFGNYRCEAGQIFVRHEDERIDVARADPRAILKLRRTTIGYVSQFLRAVPRVAAIDVVAEPLLASGVPRESARARAGKLLARLNVPERLWGLPPATFSGGEQQRVNIARGFLPALPILLLDE